MRKIKYLLLCLLMISAAGYNHLAGKETVGSHVARVELVVTVAGDCEKQVEFDHVATMGELLSELDLENSYGFDENISLTDQQLIYLNGKEGLISLSRASSEELQELSGVGEVTAGKIIAYRQEFGFSTIEDIMKISGIGEKTYLKLREYLCL